MSRIFGATMADSLDGPLDAHHRALHKLKKGNEWDESFCVRRRTVLGWTGWHGARLFTGPNVCVALDGVLYNRAELPDAASDAECIALLYERHGIDGALNRMNGDFAFALYDVPRDLVWLARDRFGLKPLYYTTAGSYPIAFASQPSGLLALPGVPREVNRQFVALYAGAHYRYFDNRPHTSPFEYVRQVPAAHVLKYRSGVVDVRPYWQLTEQPEMDAPEEELAAQYRALLRNAVDIRVESAPAPAFTLSGGMDSSSVLACAVEVTGKGASAFSTVYSDDTYDESEEIASMLEHHVETWHAIDVSTPSVMERVREMVAIHDEPVATATWLSHFVLCEEVHSAGHLSLFGGLGGDELNAGEYEYFIYHFADLAMRGQHSALEDEIQRWVAYHDHPIYPKSPELVERSFTHLVDFDEPGHCLPVPERLSRYAPALNADFFDLDEFDPILDHRFSSYLKNRTYQDLFRETAPCCLRAEDRHATYFGLDNLLPFFDHRIVEFMYRIPGSMKIRKGVTKVLLRDAMKGMLPEETRTRIKKTGWNAPAHAWFSGKGKTQLIDLVHSSSFRERGIYNVAEVDRLIQEHDHIVQTGELRENHMMFLWQLVNLEMWLAHVDELGS